MSWLFVFRKIYQLNAKTDPIRLPILFQPYHRLIVQARPVAGVGEAEPSLGTLTQMLSIDGFGDVHGEMVTLPAGYLLFVPSSEIEYRLLLQPTGREYSFELAIWADSEALAVGTSAPTPTVDLSPVETAIAALSENQQTILTELVALSNGLTALLLSDSQIVTSINQLTTAIQSQQQPTPTPAPNPSASGVAYTASQSSLRSGNTFFKATYANLTDGDQTSGGVTDGTYGAWIMATFPYKVKVTQIALSGGTLDGYGDSSGSQNGATLQGSVDGSTWANLATVSGIPNYTASGAKIVNFALNSPVDVTAIRVFKDGEIAMPRFEFQ
ncbi:MAG: discoidin domain-containing protein [Stenomitos rutilans HA7619-LM2]|jgi:hypothetical protein|nr:discoidin domain-containing protein [Stenomitos rutilans HA7619-LM2]